MVKAVDWDYWHGKWEWIENKYGRLLCYDGPDHNQQYENLSYQPNIIELLESKKYDVFIDVGAHIGLFTVIGAFHCKRVIAYEASPFLFGILLYNTRYHKNVTCKYAWVGGIGEYPKMQDQLDMIVSGGTREYHIPIIVLEWDIFDLASVVNRMLIKMDIEGNELNVLNVSRRLENMENVDWIIDIHFGQDPKEIVDKYFKNHKTIITENVLVVK